MGQGSVAFRYLPNVAPEGERRPAVLIEERHLGRIEKGVKHGYKAVKPRREQIKLKKFFFISLDNRWNCNGEVFVTVIRSR
jgi:hypothetical protein